MAIGQPKLQCPGKILCGANKQPLDVLGCITVQLTYKQRSIRHHVYVVQSLKAILALNILSRLDNLSTISTIPSQFPYLYQGLGSMKTEYEIKLQCEAKPFALSTEGQIRILLRDKVEHELKQLEATGVISKVSQPTNWCACMVVVQKKSGNVHICIDMKPLNKNVFCEIHPMPHVVDTLAQLAGARIFSKLDANVNFCLVPSLHPLFAHMWVRYDGGRWGNTLIGA